MNMNMTQRVLVIVAVSGMTLVGTAGAASAGEMTGNGKSLATVPNPEYDPAVPHSPQFLVKGRSECAYSGQNDGFHNPDLAEGPEDAATRTQTYGGFLKLGIPGLPPGLPGYACNPAGARR